MQPGVIVASGGAFVAVTTREHSEEHASFVGTSVRANIRRRSRVKSAGASPGRLTSKWGSPSNRHSPRVWEMMVAPTKECTNHRSPTGGTEVPGIASRVIQKN